MTMSEMRIKPVEILLVEDNPIDVMVTQDALERVKVKTNLHVAYDGVEALDFLNRKGKYTEAPRPDIILLDLNLPKKDGREVLKEVKGSETLRRIPIVILTTSKAEEDIFRSYELHANCFITKPVDLDQFVTIVQSIEDFWFSIVTLPDERGSK
jgi:two-component system, chemotaxis family, response regulator Rcp1